MSDESQDGGRAALEQVPLPIVHAGMVNEDERRQALTEALPHLRRPFSPEAIRFKVQTSTGGENPTGAIIVAHIDARLVVERLNAVVGGWWEDEYEGAGQNLMRCRLTVFGVTRLGMGSAPDGKALVSDALKRAAVPFGIGVSVYALPQMWRAVGGKPGELRTYKSRGKVHPKIDERTDGDLRKFYAGWLEDVGRPRFGPVLDHGDVLGAQGMDTAPALDADPEQDEGGPEEEAVPFELDDDEAQKLRGVAEQAFAALREVDPKAVMPAQFRRGLKAASVSHERLNEFIGELNEKTRDAHGRKAAG